MPTYIPIPAGSIAAIVTHVEMIAPVPDLPPPAERPDLSLVRHERPGLDWYRRLHARIGEEWLWFSRLMMTDTQLARVIHHPNVAVYSARRADTDIGLLEMDWRQAPECEILFFGLVPEAFGSGAGSWLMRQAQRIAFAEEGATRLWLHTCTFDHPGALPFYMRHGFRPFRREVEITPDPRLSGNLRKDASAFHPVIAPDAWKEEDEAGT